MDSSARKILVTGAAGCVGSLVVNELLARGYRVIATDRPRAVGDLRMRAQKDDRLEVRPADLAKASEIPALVEGATGVIHTAAIVDIAMDFEALRPINLDAVVGLYEAARAKGVATFVHFSTGSVYAPRSDGRPFDESSPVTAGNDYVRTKLLSEDYLVSRPAGGPRIAIVRPSLIFGPRGKVLAAALAAISSMLGRATSWLPPLEGGPRTNWVHALDVARAAVFLLEHDEAPDREAFNVANDDMLAIGQLFSAALSISGIRLKGPRLPYPTSVVRVLAPFIDRDTVFGLVNRAAAKAWVGIQRDEHLATDLVPRVDREALPYAFRDTMFSNAKLKALGFELAHADFASGWTDTVGWYEQERWIPARPGDGPSNGHTRGSGRAATSTKEVRAS